jgi:hypothetical protein
LHQVCFSLHDFTFMFVITFSLLISLSHFFKHLLWNFIYGMCMVYKIYGSGDRTDVLLNRLQVGQSKVHSWQGQDIFSSSKHPDRFWGLLSFYFKGTGGSIPGSKATSVWSYHSLPRNSETKNEYSYTSTPPVCLNGVDSNHFTFITANKSEDEPNDRNTMWSSGIYTFPFICHNFVWNMTYHFFSFHLLIVLHKFRFGVVHYVFQLSLADCCSYTLIWNKMCRPFSSPLIWGTVPLDQHAWYLPFARDVGSVLKSGDGNVGNSWIRQENGGIMKHQWLLLPNILWPCNLQRCWWKAAHPNWQCSFASCLL